MSSLARALIEDLDAADLAELAGRLAPHLARDADIVAAAPSVSPWLDAEEAAEYLRCNRDRVYDLIALGKLQPRRDGRRVLLRRNDLDRYLEQSLERSP